MTESLQTNQKLTMRILNDFKCAKGHVSELYRESLCKAVDCPICGLEAVRLIPAVRTYLDPISGDFPGATMKWAKNRQEQIKQERKDSGES